MDSTHISKLSNAPAHSRLDAKGSGAQTIMASNVAKQACSNLRGKLIAKVLNAENQEETERNATFMETLSNRLQDEGLDGPIRSPAFGALPLGK